MTGEHTSVIYGTHYPNRLFVGCLPPDAGAEDLGTFFASYGNVVEAKIVLDKYGVSKRFGFVTFSNAEDVEALITGKDVIFQGKKINVGPAVKKNIENNESADSPTGGVKEIVNEPIQPTAVHVAKTVIRKSPLETYQRPKYEPDDSSFRSIWGISNQKVSVWGPFDNSVFRQYTSRLNDKPTNMHDHSNKKSTYNQRFFKNTQFTPTYSNVLRANDLVQSLNLNKQ